MTHEKNELIAVKGFNTLILDYEYAGDAYMQPIATGRILSDGYFLKHVTACSRDQLINNFLHGNN